MRVRNEIKAEPKSLRRWVNSTGFNVLRHNGFMNQNIDTSEKTLFLKVRSRNTVLVGEN